MRSPPESDRVASDDPIHLEAIALAVLKSLGWCERGDANPHGFTRQILSSLGTKNQ